MNKGNHYKRNVYGRFVYESLDKKSYEKKLCRRFRRLTAKEIENAIVEGEEIFDYFEEEIE